MNLNMQVRLFFFLFPLNIGRDIKGGRALNVATSWLEMSLSPCFRRLGFCLRAFHWCSTMWTSILRSREPPGPALSRSPLVMPRGLSVFLDFKENVMTTKKTDKEKTTNQARLAGPQFRVSLAVNKTALSP